jgi:hypothetical protein
LYWFKDEQYKKPGSSKIKQQYIGFNGELIS